MSSCDAIDALEAAHIVPASEGGRMVRANGLLLRADLHTLFDLNLLGINPSPRTVVVAPRIAATSYKELDGAKLRAALSGSGPATEALEKRWQIYVAENATR